ncbi:MAG: hypothetical protein AAGI23_17145 [Bacteroidota bacterium]
MAQQTPTDDIVVVNPTRLQPMITLWNRLEGRPRREDFDRAIKAEVRDALWMLSKQWQTGEFQGEDAASALLAKVHIKTTSLTKYQAGSAEEEAFNDQAFPLEAKVENQKIPFVLDQHAISLDLRLLMGRHWRKLLKEVDFGDALINSDLIDEYKTKYGFKQPNPTNLTDAKICAHMEVWQQFAIVAKGNIDGYKVYQYISDDTIAPLITPPPGHEAKLNKLENKFVAWFEQLYLQPVQEGNPSWQPSYLEHQFECAAPKDGQYKEFVADEYYHGHLDWYNLDIKPKDGDDEEEETQTTTPEQTFTLSFLPSPATFPGMPHSRWWQLEDWNTDIGKIKPDTTDLNQLMLLDFGLNYANDWLLLPFTLPVGSIAEVAGLTVTNTFGEKIWIQAAGRGGDENWNRWSMFHLNTKGEDDVPQDLSLLLLSTASKVAEGKSLEEVYLLRDEVANMVWAVEAIVPLPTGKGRRGKEVGLEYRAKLASFVQKDESEPIVENEAKIRYQIVNTVPEHWIPFIPAYKENDNREIQLQRAAMPRIFEGDQNPPQKIEPRTSLLREGLDDANRYFIHEEEVPRAGILVSKSFQRTRWYNGKVCTWVGIKKRIGRGEGHSGLVFDQIIPKEQKKDD